MARIEWVKQRLDNWALWHERQAGGGLGFASQSSFLNEVDASRYRESYVPVDEVEAGITDQAVASLKLGHGHLFETLSLMYLRGCGVIGTARAMRRAESTIHANLSHADALLAAWFTERKRQQAAARAAMQAKLNSSTS
jgi:hypothetical protein